MNNILGAGGTLLVNISYGCYHIRRSLDSHTLHVMFNSPNTAHFFPATCATWPAMYQHGKGRTMTGGLFGTGLVQHQQATMPWTGTQHIITGDFCIGCYNRADKGALTHAREFYAFAGSTIRHDCT